MPLLHWSTLEPHPPANLAAVRFAAPVRVSNLRIFPSGARLFEQVPDIVAYALQPAPVLSLTDRHLGPLNPMLSFCRFFSMRSSLILSRRRRSKEPSTS